MKVGDTVPVQIGAHVVAQATVRELGDGTATLVVPATLVVMGTRTTLDDLPSTGHEGTETLITGVDRAGTEPVESTTGSEPISNSEAVTEASTSSGEATSDAAAVGSTGDSGGVVDTSTAQPVAGGGEGVPSSEPVSNNENAGTPNETQNQE